MKTKRAYRDPRIFNYIAAGLMLLMLILQFLPFWHYEGGSASINGYVWMPGSHGAVEAWLQSQVGDWFNIQYLFAQPVMQLLLGVIGIVVCMAACDCRATLLLPMACGGAGLWGYLGKAALRLGSGWVFHLIVCIAMILVAAAAFVPKAEKA